MTIRDRLPRARTESMRRLSKTAIRRGAMLYPERNYPRPRTRGDCVDMERPCPYVACRYHMALDVDPIRGSVKLNFPSLALHEMSETCALDVADRGGLTLEAVGDLLNVTRERLRQIEEAALSRLATAGLLEQAAEDLGIHLPARDERAFIALLDALDRAPAPEAFE